MYYYLLIEQKNPLKEETLLDEIVSEYVEYHHVFQHDHFKVYVFIPQDINYQELISSLISESMNTLRLYSYSVSLSLEHIERHYLEAIKWLSKVPFSKNNWMRNQDLVMYYKHHISLDFVSFILQDALQKHYLMESVLAYLTHNQNVTQTAKETFIHRNTLIQRLEKFKELTGFDVKQFEDAFLIYTLLTYES
jgi:sugar diacid utilization regulator